ncbi:MAG: DUF1007 family protein [Parvibaculum sp.]|nr:DUF1007 family protein [Parvibaculum sp.]
MQAGANGTHVFFAALLALAVFCVPASPARAHPHVWIDMRTELRFDDEGRVTAVQIAWTFDEFYSAFALEGAPRNGSGYDPAYLAELAGINLQNLAEWDYFTEISSGGNNIALGIAEDGKSTWDEASGRLSLSFTVPLKEPLAPAAAAPLQLRVYDPSYYISIEYEKTDPVRMTGTVPQGCTLASETPNVENVWLGLPETAFTDENSRIGASFATIVTVTCPSAS